MRSDRRRFLHSTCTTAAGLLLFQDKWAFADKPQTLAIYNDYDARVKFDLFNPETSISKVYATYSLGPSEEATKLRDGENYLLVNAAWGIRVRFENGAQSDIMRLLEVGYPGSIGASSIYDRPHAEYPQGREVDVTGGLDIDSGFDASERSILRDAVTIFYERFLQPYGHGCPEICSLAGTKFDDEFPFKDFLDLPKHCDRRDIIEAQRARLSYNTVVLRKPFPKIKLQYAVENANYLARAPVGVVRVRPHAEDDPTGPYPVDGSFVMKINDWFLLDTKQNRLYGDPAFWAGVIAHEALHNLGHRHPDSRDAGDYHLYQMIIVELMVMKNKKIQYGDRKEEPISCRPWQDV